MAGTAVFRMVVSSDSMKNATATSHGSSRLAIGFSSEGARVDVAETGEAAVSAQTPFSSAGSSSAAVAGWCMAEPATIGTSGRSWRAWRTASTVEAACRCSTITSALAALARSRAGERSLTVGAMLSSSTGGVFSSAKVLASCSRPDWP